MRNDLAQAAGRSCAWAARSGHSPENDTRVCTLVVMWTLTFFAKLEWMAPVLLRAMIGFSFFAVHGFDKVNPGGDWGSLDAWDWGSGFAGNVDHPAFLAYIAVWTEFLGGFALLAGLLTRWASLGLMAVMLYAALVHHAGDPFHDKELALTFATGCFALVCLGPGPLSLDRLFFGRAALED